MRILMTSEPCFPYHPGGAGKATFLLARALTTAGHEVHVVCLREEDQPSHCLDGVHIHRLAVPEFPGRWTVAREDQHTSAFLTRAIMDRFPPGSFDVIHDSGGFLAYWFPVLRVLKRWFQAPLVFQIHFELLGYQASSGQPCCYQDLHHIGHQCYPIRFADAVVCPSRAVARWVDRFYRPATRAHVVPNPLDQAMFDATDDPRWRQSLAPHGEPLVLFAGRVVSPEKRADVVWRAVRIARRELPGLRLVVLGRHPSDAQRLEAKLGRCVACLPWQTDMGRLATIYRAMDGVVLASRFETFGLVAAEAMAAGTPVISTPVGAMPDLIQDGHNGYLIQHTDRRRQPAEIAARIVELMSLPPEQRQRMRQRAADGIHATLHPAKIAAQMVAIYRRACASPARVRLGRPRDAHRIPSAVPSSHWDQLEQRCPRCTVRKVGDEALRWRVGEQGGAQPMRCALARYQALALEDAGSQGQQA